MMRAAKITSKRLPEETVRSRAHEQTRGAFTLIELLVVIGIIVLLATMMFPAVKSLTKSNDQSQSVNLVRTMLGTARSIAISQHREAGVVFFEESSKYSNPVNGGQTAMQLFVAAFDQTNVPSGWTGYELYSPARQYLPTGVRVATLMTNSSGSIQTGDSGVGPRAIIFDSTGQLVLRTGVFSPLTTSGTAGQYPFAYGDWNFGNPTLSDLTLSNTLNYVSSPGFFLYSKAEYDAFIGDKAAWIQQHADVVIVNANTGAVFQ